MMGHSIRKPTRRVSKAVASPAPVAASSSHSNLDLLVDLNLGGLIDAASPAVGHLHVVTPTTVPTTMRLLRFCWDVRLAHFSSRSKDWGDPMHTSALRKAISDSSMIASNLMASLEMLIYTLSFQNRSEYRLKGGNKLSPHRKPENPKARIRQEFRQELSRRKPSQSSTVLRTFCIMNWENVENCMKGVCPGCSSLKAEVAGSNPVGATRKHEVRAVKCPGLSLSALGILLCVG